MAGERRESEIIHNGRVEFVTKHITGEAHKYQKIFLDFKVRDLVALVLEKGDEWLEQVKGGGRE